MRSLICFAALVILAATTQALTPTLQPTLKALNLNSRRKFGAKEVNVTCDSSEGTPAFTAFLDAGANKNIAAMEQLLSEDFVGIIPEANINFNKTGFLNYLQSIWPGSGIRSIWPNTRFAAGNAGVAIVDFAGFATQTPNSPIQSAELGMVYQTDETDFSKIRLFIDLRHTEDVSPTNKTLMAFEKAAAAFKAANATELIKQFSSDPTIFELSCNSESVQSITKYEFEKQVKQAYSVQLNAHLNIHKTIINSNYGLVHSTAYITRSQAPTQIIVEQIAVYAVNELGHFSQWYQFSKDFISSV